MSLASNLTSSTEHGRDVPSKGNKLSVDVGSSQYLRNNSHVLILTSLTLHWLNFIMQSRTNSIVWPETKALQRLKYIVIVRMNITFYRVYRDNVFCIRYRNRWVIYTYISVSDFFIKHKNRCVYLLYHIHIYIYIFLYVHLS